MQRLEELRRESERITLEICELKIGRNRTVPISRIPAEVLGSIFEAYVANHWREYTSSLEKHSGRSRVSPYAWFRSILHVCHDWRDIAFLTHRIWTRIVPTRPSCVKFMLTYTGQLPLDMLVSRSPGKGSDARAMNAQRRMLEELVRMRIAQLSISARSYLQLRTMDSGVYELVIEELLVDMLIGHDSISVLSAAEMPSLISLEIRGGSVKLLNSLQRPSLTSLSFSTGDTVRTGELTSALAQLSFLRHLHLSLGLEDFDFPPEDLGDAHTVQLRLLESLFIKGHICQVAAFFELLRIPQDTSVHLSLDYDEVSAHQYDAAVGSIMAKMERTGAAAPERTAPILQPRSMAINRCRRGQTDALSVQLWPVVCDWEDETEERPNEPKPRFQLSTKCNSFGILTIKDLLSLLMKRVDLSELVGLRIALALPAGEWSEHLHRHNLSKLENLWLYGTDVTEGFLRVLAMSIFPLRPGSLAREWYYLIPNLRSVYIVSAFLRDSPDPWSRNFMHVPRFKSLLESRTALARKLNALILVSCFNVRDDDLVAFNQFTEHACRAIRCTDWDSGFLPESDAKYEGDLSFEVDSDSDDDEIF
ncbi:hypothetical protein NM688_g2621 [Phlebia brevispora]|uniref:Uncharacterized protein n=1 Tax=Phlebia brevispora TaxID=194682 RepID=A0ACC1T7Z2_9APHY|nr:hypothetical protein NM688_g2621 [Phlebia brevispora]